MDIHRCLECGKIVKVYDGLSEETIRKHFGPSGIHPKLLCEQTAFQRLTYSGKQAAERLRAMANALENYQDEEQSPLGDITHYLDELENCVELLTPFRAAPIVGFNDLYVKRNGVPKGVPNG